jgi:hypothetical protein
MKMIRIMARSGVPVMQLLAAVALGMLIFFLARMVTLSDGGFFAMSAGDFAVCCY